MQDWQEGVEHGIAEMLQTKDKHNTLILAIDSFLKTANEVGWTDSVLDDLERTKAMLESDIVELNIQIEKQNS